MNDNNTYRKIAREFRKIRADYAFNADIMNEEDERSRRLKYCVSCLPLADQTLLIRYADGSSYRKLGKELGVSHETIRAQIVRIRQKVRELYNNPLIQV